MRLGQAVAGAVLLAALAAGACAGRGDPAPQTPASAAAEASDGGFVTAPPARRGVMVPGDPSSGTAAFGAGAGGLDTTTGTAGTRVNPGSVGDSK
jgi:hypothetical protein